jgi:TLD
MTRYFFHARLRPCERVCMGCGYKHLNFRCDCSAFLSHINITHIHTHTHTHTHTYLHVIMHAYVHTHVCVSHASPNLSIMWRNLCEPTCCGTQQSRVFGVYSAEPWKNSDKYYGSASSFMFSLSPEVRKYSWSGMCFPLLLVLVVLLWYLGGMRTKTSACVCGCEYVCGCGCGSGCECECGCGCGCGCG